MIYFDNCATTRVKDKVADAVLDAMLNDYGNPSSLHHFGMDAYRLVNDARAKVANLIGAKTDCIIFTSSGTDSNNIALLGAAYANKDKGNRIISTAIEHGSVLQPLKHLENEGFEIIYIKPNPITNKIETNDIINAINQNTILLSIMHANNENGEILPISEIVSRAKEIKSDLIIHSDCVQTYGKIPVELYKINVDLLSASGHKIGAPKGVGILYIKDGIEIKKMSHGGSQEKGYKPGTENVPGIVGFGLASEISMIDMNSNYKYIKSLNDYMRDNLKSIPNVIINSGNNSIPYILNFSLVNYNSNDLINYLGMRDIYVSAGAACNKNEISHVLKAYGYDKERLSGALRVSFSTDNSFEDIEVFCKALTSYIKQKGEKNVF